jgi:hypothetical protein
VGRGLIPHTLVSSRYNWKAHDKLGYDHSSTLLADLNRYDTEMKYALDETCFAGRRILFPILTVKTPGSELHRLSMPSNQ